VRVVLDTDVVVAALRSPTGASAALLRLLSDGKGVLVLSVALALEYEATCQLPEHRLAAGLDPKEVELFIYTLIGMAEPVNSHYRWRPLLSDPGDEMVLETAVNGRSDVLVTFNRRDYGAAPALFGIDVLLPREALQRLTA
jgi:putative PIN family toxin of toxin-antitoxin system